MWRLFFLQGSAPPPSSSSPAQCPQTLPPSLPLPSGEPRSPACLGPRKKIVHHIPAGTLMPCLLTSACARLGMMRLHPAQMSSLSWKQTV